MLISSIRRLGQQLLLGSSLVVLGSGWLVQEPHAARRGTPDIQARPCTAQNVAGSYGFSGSGTILPTPAEPSASLIATVGLLTFDGDEHWHTTNQTLTINGHVTQPSMTGTYKGGIPGAEANDQKVTLHSLSVAEFADGKFKSYAGYENGLELAAQLGMMGGAAEKPAGEPTAAAGDTLGVAECDLYISKMRECMGALPDAARGAFENGMKTALDQWKQSIEAGGDAAKQALGQACKSTLDAAKQAAGQLCPNVKWE